MVQSRRLLKAGTHLLTKLPLPDECQLSHLLPCSHSCLEPIALSIWRGRGWRPGGREELPPGGSEAGAISRSGLGSLGAHRPALHTCLAHGGLAKWPSPRGVLKWQGGREGRTRRRADSVLPLLCPQGDSGGPLICGNVAQGIASYGRKNGSTPRAYTKLSSFLPWIKKTMKSL